MKQNRLTERHIEMVNRYLDKGMTGAAISKALGVSLSCFNKWKRKNSDRIGKKQRLKKPLPVVPDEILKLILGTIKGIVDKENNSITSITDRYKFADNFEIESDLVIECIKAYDKKWSDKASVHKFLSRRIRWTLNHYIEKLERLEKEYKEMKYLVKEYQNEDIFRIFNPSTNLSEYSIEYLFEIL